MTSNNEETNETSVSSWMAAPVDGGSHTHKVDIGGRRTSIRIELLSMSDLKHLLEQIISKKKYCVQSKGNLLYLRRKRDDDTTSQATPLPTENSSSEEQPASVKNRYKCSIPGANKN